MKKSFAFISLFLLLGVASIFADVTVKKLPDGNAEVYFFYANPRASEVLLAGDFTDWQSGALPMTKTDKGFEITKTFKPTDELRYKFISDGNWTTDLKAPDFVDDGFGGKNSHVVIADMLGGDGADGSAKAKINFVSWTMIGTQAKFLTQSTKDRTTKGMDLDNVTIGMKSYNKFAGNFLPNCPVYVEIALAETEIDNEYKANSGLIYLLKKDDFGQDEIKAEDTLKTLLSDIFSNPVDYLARSDDNSADNDGPGSNPFLGHLKFGFNTPYVNFLTGFNYAKPEVRNAILWTTIDGHWDAGYQHVGGFSVFSLGDKVVAAIQEKSGLKLDVGFAPNKTADRKGTKYGYWGWAGGSLSTKNGIDIAFDVQSNGMYNGEYMFDDAVEHDFIAGAKFENIGLGDAGKLKVGAQALIATHQKSSDDLGKNSCDYFGYSTDVFYRETDFDFLKKLAAQVQIGYKQEYNEYRGKYLDSATVDLGYRLRGSQASMLYVRENHDDGTFDLSEMLGVLNSQNIDFAINATVQEKKLAFGVEGNVNFPLGTDIDKKKYWTAAGAKDEEAEKGTYWYIKRNSSEMDPLYGDEKGELTAKPSVTVDLGKFIDNAWGGTITAYGKFNLNFDSDHKYAQSDSSFRFKNAGLSWAYTAEDKEAALKGVNVYYGLDNADSARLFNTLIGQIALPYDITVVVGAGLKTINDSTDAAKASEYNTVSKDLNNPFGAVVGVSKKLANLKKPVIYAQFVYNMDCFKNFGDGQEQLSLSGANVSSRWDKGAEVGKINAVNHYDGKAAVRVGIRWDI